MNGKDPDKAADRVVSVVFRWHIDQSMFLAQMVDPCRMVWYGPSFGCEHHHSSKDGLSVIQGKLFLGQVDSTCMHGDLGAVRIMTDHGSSQGDSDLFHLADPGPGLHQIIIDQVASADLIDARQVIQQGRGRGVSGRKGWSRANCGKPVLQCR